MVRGREVPPPIDSAISMFMLCSAMEFKHLPMAGGLYDQSPELLDRFMYIFGKQHEERARQEQREKGKSPQPKPRNA